MKRWVWVALPLGACVDDFPAFTGGDVAVLVRDAQTADRPRVSDASDRDLSDFDMAVVVGPDRGVAPRPDAADPRDAGPPIDLAVPVDRGAPVDAARPPPDAGGDGPRYIWVDAGKEHTCAVRRDGTVVCWGNDDNGRIAAPPGRFERVTAGEAHNCAWGDLIFPVCWGRNDRGSTEPPFQWFRTIEAGRRTTCGIDVFFDLECWGEDYHGLRAQEPDNAWLELSLTWHHACVADLLNGVVCWGDDGARQLVRDPTGVLVAAGTAHTCVMDPTPRIHCAGSEPEGPPNMALGVWFRALTAGEGHTCGLTVDGEIRCWGNNMDGRATPPPGRFRQVSAGSDHTCALREDGEILCWGKNHRGQNDVP